MKKIVKTSKLFIGVQRLGLTATRHHDTSQVKLLSTEKKSEKMDHLKSNPYFSKYEEKLKNVYQ